MEIRYTDKILFKFHELIWSKSPVTRRMDIWTVDTVIIEDEPHEWYFTNKKGKLRKKFRENSKIPNILKTFNKKAKGCDIVAQFVTTKEFSKNLSMFDRGKKGENSLSSKKGDE